MGRAESSAHVILRLPLVNKGPVARIVHAVVRIAQRLGCSDDAIAPGCRHMHVIQHASCLRGMRRVWGFAASQCSSLEATRTHAVMSLRPHEHAPLAHTRYITQPQHILGWSPVWGRAARRAQHSHSDSHAHVVRTRRRADRKAAAPSPPQPVKWHGPASSQSVGAIRLPGSRHRLCRGGRCKRL